MTFAVKQTKLSETRQRRLFRDWNLRNRRAISSYLQNHGAVEAPPEGMRVIDGEQLLKERRSCVGLLSLPSEEP